MLLGFKLMIQNGEYKNFFLYTVFLKKKKRKKLCSVAKPYQFHALTLKSYMMFKGGLKMKALSIFLLGFTDQCGNFNFL